MRLQSLYFAQFRRLRDVLALQHEAYLRLKTGPTLGLSEFDKNRIASVGGGGV